MELSKFITMTIVNVVEVTKNYPIDIQFDIGVNPSIIGPSNGQLQSITVDDKSLNRIKFSVHID